MGDRLWREGWKLPKSHFSPEGGMVVAARSAPSPLGVSWGGASEQQNAGSDLAGVVGGFHPVGSVAATALGRVWRLYGKPC